MHSVDKLWNAQHTKVRIPGLSQLGYGLCATPPAKHVLLSLLSYRSMFAYVACALALHLASIF